MHALLARILWAALLTTPILASLPSCEEDTNTHCVAEGSDLSPEGITACLHGLPSRSSSCTTYLALMASCTDDISSGGACNLAHREGEAVPCLMQRVAPDQLTEACRAALPKEKAAGLAKFWAAGKRLLLIDEIMDLSADEKDTYERWKKKKGAKKTEKDKEREYAVKKAKQEKTTHLVTEKVAAEVGKLVADGVTGTELQAEAVKSARAAWASAVAEDLTGTLKPAAQSTLNAIAKAAITQAKGKAEL